MVINRMVTFLTDGLRDIAAAITRNQRIGNAARALYTLRDGIFGASPEAAERTLSEVERFEAARGAAAKEWKNN